MITDNPVACQDDLTIDPSRLINQAWYRSAFVVLPQLFQHVRRRSCKSRGCMKREMLSVIRYRIVHTVLTTIDRVISVQTRAFTYILLASVAVAATRNYTI